MVGLSRGNTEFLRKKSCSGGMYKYVFHMKTYTNNHIYSTLFKTQERESDRSKEIEQRKESQKTHTNKTTRTCDPKY